MASTYVNDLRLNEMATGDQSGSWGTVTNTNLELIGEALGFGTEAITTNADAHTSTIADGSTDPIRAIFIKYTGTLDSACTITIGPNTVNKFCFIHNATSGSQSIIISQGSGANVTIATGQTKGVYLDGAGSGAAVVDAFATLSVVDLLVDDDLTVTDDMTVGGTLGVTGIATFTDDIIIGDGKTIGSASDVDAITIAANGQVTLTQTLIGTALDISGDIDVDGTTNLDIVDIDGAVNMATTALVTGVLTTTAGAIFNGGFVAGGVGSFADGSAANPSITHTGDLNTGIFFPAADTLAFAEGGAEIMRIDSSSRLVKGATTAVPVASTASAFGLGVHAANQIGISISNYAANAGGSVIAFAHSRSGTVGTVGTSVNNGDNLFNMRIAGDDGTDTISQAAAISVEVDAAPGSNDMPGRMLFSTTADGAASPTERMRIDKSGNVDIVSGNLFCDTTSGIFFSGGIGNFSNGIYGVGTNNVAFNVNGSERMRINSDGNLRIGNSATGSRRVQIESAGANYTIGLDNTSSSPYGLFIDYSTAAPNSNNHEYLVGVDSSATRILIYSSGNIVNANNSYGAISDVKLKENIIDASSQWDDIKALTVRKYSMKSDELDAPNRLGVIAQELEAAGMGGLVNESQDKDKDLKELGTTTKSVNYSILYMKAVKALQEAMTRIETLETKVAALEG